MIFKPADDGKTHINIYSKGSTALGRFLSNFADCNVDTEDGPFRTIEGYWYWLSCGDEDLRTTNGWESKKLGREQRAEDWLKSRDFKDKIRKAIYIKIVSDRDMLDQFLKSNLEFTHYYVYGTKVVDVPEAGWIIEFIDWLRTELKGNTQ